MGYTEVPSLDIFSPRTQCPNNLQDQCQSDVDRKSAASTPPTSPGPSVDEGLLDQLSGMKSAQLAKMLMDLAGSCKLKLNF